MLLSWWSELLPSLQGFLVDSSCNGRSFTLLEQHLEPKRTPWNPKGHGNPRKVLFQQHCSNRPPHLSSLFHLCAVCSTVSSRQKYHLSSASEKVTKRKGKSKIVYVFLSRKFIIYLFISQKIPWELHRFCEEKVFLQSLKRFQSAKKRFLKKSWKKQPEIAILVCRFLWKTRIRRSRYVGIWSILPSSRDSTRNVLSGELVSIAFHFSRMFVNVWESDGQFVTSFIVVRERNK